MVDVGSGLLAALCWGFADFLAKEWGERYGVLNAVLLLHVFGVVILLPFLALVPSLNGSLVKVMIAALLIGLISPLSYGLLYGALAAGELSINSPIASSSAAISVLLAFVFLRERPALVVLIGIGVIVTGVILIIMHPGPQKRFVTWRLTPLDITSFRGCIYHGRDVLSNPSGT
jgi:uncharacterized membrane protein